MNWLVPELCLARRKVVVRAGLGPFRPAVPITSSGWGSPPRAQNQNHGAGCCYLGVFAPRISSCCRTGGKQKSSLGAAGI